MSRRMLLLSSILVASWTPGPADAAPRVDTTPQVIASGTDRVTLLELYTSEGCSSCPPADRWLSSLEDAPGLWTRFVPMALHVDYWDDLGWADRFASARYSDRQRRYAAEGGTRIVYTPGVFRNGREWRHWRQAGATTTPDAGPAGDLVLSVGASRYRAQFSPAAPVDAATLHVALLGLDLSSNVTAGENDGRRLEHDFVVLALSSTPMRAADDAWHAAAALPAPAVPAGRYAIAAWVTRAGRQAPLQAAGGFLAGNPVE